MLNVSVNVNIAALPSVGSVVSRDMTHAITGRRGALYQLLAIATTRGGPRREIQRVPPHIHTASNNINNNKTQSNAIARLSYACTSTCPFDRQPRSSYDGCPSFLSFQPPSRAAGSSPLFVSFVIQTLTDSNPDVFNLEISSNGITSEHPGYERGRNAIVASRRYRAGYPTRKLLLRSPNFSFSARREGGIRA